MSKWKTIKIIWKNKIILSCTSDRPIAIDLKESYSWGIWWGGLSLNCQKNEREKSSWLLHWISSRKTVVQKVWDWLLGTGRRKEILGICGAISIQREAYIDNDKQ